MPKQCMFPLIFHYLNTYTQVKLETTTCAAYCEIQRGEINIRPNIRIEKLVFVTVLPLLPPCVPRKFYANLVVFFLILYPGNQQSRRSLWPPSMQN